MKTIAPTIFLNRWANLSAASGLVTLLAWSFPWYYSLVNPESNALIFFLFLLTSMLLCYFCGWVMNSVEKLRSFSQIAIILLMAGGLVLLVYPLFFGAANINLNAAFFKAFDNLGKNEEGMRLFIGFIGYLLLMGRAVRQANKPIGITENIRNFQLGSVAFLLYGVTFAVDHVGLGMSSFLGFLGSGMVSMIAGRWAETSQHRGGRVPKNTFKRALFLWMIPAALAISFLGMGYVAHHWFGDFAASLITLFISALFILTITLLSPVLIVLVEGMYRIGLWIFSRIGEILPQSPAAELALEMQQNQPAEIYKLDQNLVDYNRFVLIGIVLIVFILVLLVLRWKPWKNISMQMEEETSFLPPLKPITGSDQQNPKLGLRLNRFSKFAAAAQIRYIYFLLLRLAEKRGVIRPKAQTPLEFLPSLNSLFLGCEKECEFITGAYLMVRYGQLPETHEVLENAQKSWNKIKASKNTSQTISAPR